MTNALLTDFEVKSLKGEISVTVQIARELVQEDRLDCVLSVLVWWTVVPKWMRTDSELARRSAVWTRFHCSSDNEE